MEKKSKIVRKLVYSAVCIALALVLPLLTGQIPEIGKSLQPMHIAVLLAGFVCGWQYGAVVGLVSPMLRFLIFGRPNLYPDAIVMTFELAAYGLLAGLLYKLLPKKTGYIYVSLLGAMLGGRLVWGLTKYIVLGVKGTAFPMSAFVAGGFVDALPGIVLQIVLIPLIVMALKKAKLMLN